MDEDVRTLWCGNLSEKVTEEILYELFLQGGPVQRVYIPKDRDGKQRTFGFITYKHIDSVIYALNLFDGTKLFNRAICMSPKNSVESPQKTNTQDQHMNCNHLLQSGQQILLGNRFPRIQLDMFGANMLPNSGPHSKQTDTHAYHDNRRSSKVHPYRREQSNSNQHKDHRSRNSHKNRRSNDYSRREYSSSRHNYR